MPNTRKGNTNLKNATPMRKTLDLESECEATETEQKPKVKVLKHLMSQLQKEQTKKQVEDVHLSARLPDTSTQDESLK